MPTSIFELFTIGIGPSSSHSIGPMRAANRFCQRLVDDGVLDAATEVRVELFGSLALTGKGHGTDIAVMAGLEGHEPHQVDPVELPRLVDRVASSHRLRLAGRRVVRFDPTNDLQYRKRESLPRHPNGMRFTSLDAEQQVLLTAVYYSIGGGFVVGEDDPAPERTVDHGSVPFPFRTADDLVQTCDHEHLSIAEVVLRNEIARRSESDVRSGVLRIWAAMQECVDRGSRRTGLLPGPLGVERRSSVLRDALERRADDPPDPMAAMDWVNVFALAVSEENASAQRVVTAPTNGAAGIIPAVLHYYAHFVPGANADGVVTALLTATAIGSLFKENASISGAEVGCQGEVGVASSMAAAGLTAALGGTPRQVENAAEIAIEHHLGMTCDPVGGLVQVPCIERNAMGAMKAINAQRLSMQGTGAHVISLDKAIATMRQTGADMKNKYKETSRGGLAVTIKERFRAAT